ncbi:MAG: N(4)-(beta-N-acetylglucosaminyl)-L-asparaginase [Planctomycetes bacterium]|nr:N(4)-(beta-N-acetylglucosaminyl)-L-asparaginase [Planctomycetota bacterium]
MSQSCSRRAFLQSSAAGLAGVACTAEPAVASASLAPATRLRSPVAVASENGLQAVQIAVEKMLAGWRPVDAAVAGVTVVEDDPLDDSVGLGGLPNEEGVVELDACVMDGPSGLAGAVAALQGIQNPSQVALKVMRHTDHVLLVGEGALRFARSYGFPVVELLTAASRKVWLEWRERRGAADKWLHPDENGPHGKAWFDQWKHKTGTIHLGAVDANGDCGSCTTTSGLAFKIPGRVGDSPLIGCGNYCDNDVGTGGSTGRGEACILANGGAFIVQQMAAGKSPTDACVAAVQRVVRLTKVKRLLDDQGRPNFQVKFYAVGKNGQFGAASMYPSKFAVADDAGARLLDTAAQFATAPR